MSHQRKRMMSTKARRENENAVMGYHFEFMGWDKNEKIDFEYLFFSSRREKVSNSLNCIPLPPPPAVAIILLIRPSFSLVLFVSTALALMHSLLFQKNIVQASRLFFVSPWKEKKCNLQKCTSPNAVATRKDKYTSAEKKKTGVNWAFNYRNLNNSSISFACWSKWKHVLRLILSQMSLDSCFFWIMTIIIANDLYFSLCLLHSSPPSATTS